MSGFGSTRSLVRVVLDAIESRDLDRVESRLAADASWQNVPHPAAVGRAGVIAMFERILPLCERVDWEIVSEAYGPGVAWLERIDHFWIDGERHSVACNGVFRVDTSAGVLRSVRDYVDLGEWRGRIVPVYDRRAREPARTVVERHLDAVRHRDVVAMAADYAADALLVRDGTAHDGRRAISAYFRTVPDRLGDAALDLDAPDESLAVRWRIVRDGAVASSGTDTYTVESGRIVRQVVSLDGTDF